MAYEFLIYEKIGPVARITLNRPDSLNALSLALKAELENALDESVADKEIRSIVLTGAGRAFCSGYDISVNYSDRNRDDDAVPTAEEWRDKLRGDLENLLKVWDCPKPVIAAVNGYAVGGGMDLAMVCDLTIASEQARFGEPEIRHSSATPTLILPWLIGLKRAKELLLLGDLIGAREAYDIGMVNRVVAHESLEAEALKWAKRVALVPPQALRLNKEVIHRTLDMMGLRQALAYNVEVASLLHVTQESVEWLRYGRKHGLKKFLEKRDGPFKEHS